jgi:hypothetical protein
MVLEIGTLKGDSCIAFGLARLTCERFVTLDFDTVWGLRVL